MSGVLPEIISGYDVNLMILVTLQSIHRQLHATHAEVKSS